MDFEAPRDQSGLWGMGKPRDITGYEGTSQYLDGPGGLEGLPDKTSARVDDSMEDVTTGLWNSAPENFEWVSLY